MISGGSGDPVLLDLLQKIERFGWAVRNVGAGTERGEAAFSYTIGLTAMRHDEVIVQGLPFNVAQTFLNNIGHEVREGRHFLPGVVTEKLTAPGSPVAFIRADDVSGLTAVERVFGRVSAVQMIWSDSSGRLPWVNGHNNPPDAQPLLGELPSQWLRQ